MTTNSASLASSAAANDLRGIKPPVDIPNPWLWVAIAVVVLLLAVIAWVAWKKWRQKVEIVPAAPVIPPHVRAREKLAGALALIAQPRPFCILVSDTVRLYLEERFSFRAPERTTEEFLHELKATNLLTPDQKQTLGEFLEICDMVKFARYEPGTEELHALHRSAVRLLDETEPEPVAMPASEPQP